MKRMKKMLNKFLIICIPMKKILLLALPLLFLVWCSSIKNTNTENTWNVLDASQSEVSANTVIALPSHCGLTIDSPASGATVSFPLTIQWTVDNTQAQGLGCSWTMFEAQAGVARLYADINDPAIGNPVLMQVPNWMTNGPVSFSIVIPFDNSNAGFPSGTPMQVVFEEESPSGAASDTLVLPIVLQ